MRQRKRLFSSKPVAEPAPRFTVEKDHVVTIDYTLNDENGTVVDTTEGRGVLSYIHGSNQIPKVFQESMQGHYSGDKVSKTFPPQDTFGEYDQSRIQELEAPLFEDVKKLQKGMQFETMTEAGLRVVTVTDVEENSATVDLNHPLAGKTLTFSATIVSVRPAAPDEIEMNRIR